MKYIMVEISKEVVKWIYGLMNGIQKVVSFQ